jgi:uncharacterized membrane protein HdeD (DUF308 family)
MASNDDRGRWLLTAGGILSIVAGIFQINNGGLLMAFFLIPNIMPIWQTIMGVLFLVLGILAIVGGISAIRRKMFSLSLAGAICALASGLLGILAVIFVSLARREFRAEN